MKSVELLPRLVAGMTFLVVGLGGVGSLLARYLGLLLGQRTEASRLVLLDGDAYEPDNASRQWFKRPGPKAEIVKEELLDVVRGGHLTILALHRYLTADNIGRIIPGTGRQVVVLAVDNHRTRALVSRHVENLALPSDDAETALFSGGNDPADHGLRGSYGNVQVFVKRRRGGSIPLTQYHEEIAHPQDALPHDLSCTEQLDRRPQLLASNIHVAAWLYSSLYLYLCGLDRLPYSEIYVDWVDGLVRPAAYPAPHELLKEGSTP